MASYGDSFWKTVLVLSFKMRGPRIKNKTSDP
ncbi:MAG: hypothetical protein ACI9RU_003063, partial [Litorivivens sp.]